MSGGIAVFPWHMLWVRLWLLPRVEKPVLLVFVSMCSTYIWVGEWSVLGLEQGSLTVALLALD